MKNLITIIKLYALYISKIIHSARFQFIWYMVEELFF